MLVAGFTASQWLVLVEHELLLFAGIFFLVGALDDLAVDFAWLWLRLTGRAQSRTWHPANQTASKPQARIAVCIPAWNEAVVIGTTVTHMLSVWPHSGRRIYVGCYRNDPATIDAAARAANSDARVRLVVHECDGPSTKADCLNRLYHAIEADEARCGEYARMVVLHDAEDMVDPAALDAFLAALGEVHLVQLPVLPVPVPGSRWVSGHYVEEFAENHGKAMVVRDALRVGIPLAGVGCAIERNMLGRLALGKNGNNPFAADGLTEDYELGLGVAALGGKARFLRFRHRDGRLVATRACFPATLGAAVRQKARWVHGIAFQGWDRLGWSHRPAEIWMRLRDRRGPFTALVLAAAYALLALSVIAHGLRAAGLAEPMTLTPALFALLLINFVVLLWRVAFRFAFTARDYGLREALRAVLRMPLANVIAIMAGRRALFAYLGSLAGRRQGWDKTEHSAHPVLLATGGAAA